jgi:3-methyladenine DNA glycosylase/8-oxoguanine DNA glycosylase
MDLLDGFDPPPGLIRDLHRRMPGLRIARSNAVFEALVPTVLAQKVTGVEAGRAWKGLVRAFGEPAPSPESAPLGPAAGSTRRSAQDQPHVKPTPVSRDFPSVRLPPSPSVLADLPYHAFHPFGVEMRRANAIRTLAARAGRLERVAAMPNPEGRQALAAFPGIGPWTAAEVALVALGDADAVSVGDYHIPHTVSWALAGEPRGSDERMLELLEPFAGHRGRVIRLIEAAGISAPRYGPKATARSIGRL